MAETAERYRRLATRFTALVESVPPDQWEAPSPCQGWTARDLVAHLVEGHGIFLGLVDRELGPIPPVDDDPLGAWTAARDVVQADLDDPGKASAAFEGELGPSTFEQAIGRFLCTDLVVHSWDLARATGQDERLDPDDVRRVSADMRSVGDALRGSGAFGPAVEPPAGADEQAALLAFLGRRT